MENTVYVYNEYCDKYSFGEMTTKVFATRAEARKYLRFRLSMFSGANIKFSSSAIQKSDKNPIEDYLASLGFQLNPDDIITEDYVSFTNENDCKYWQIIQRNVE